VTLDVREGGWNLSVGQEHQAARFRPVGVLREAEEGRHMRRPGHERSVRAVVDLVAVSGGIRPRALIGGEFVPGAGSRLSIEVNHSGDLGWSASAGCPGLADGRPLVAGLPLEFAQAALDGLVRVTCDKPLPAGALSIDRAAHDEVDSSPIAFGKAAGVLRRVLASIENGEALDRDKLRELLR